MKYILNIIALVFLFVGNQASAQLDGRLDSTFGTAGKISIPIHSAPSFTGFYIRKNFVQQDGKMMVLLSKNYQIDDSYFDTSFLCRLMPTGQLDLGFGEQGFQSIGMNVRDLLVLPNDQFLVLGNDNDAEILIQKYLVGGVPDATYGNNGRVYTGLFMYVNAATLQPSGKIVVAGGLGNANVVAVFNTDGSRDMVLGKDGFVTIEFDAANLFENIASVLVQPDGKIVVGGLGYTNQYRTFLLRLKSNGERDSTFGINGSHSYPVNTYGLSELLLQQDGKIVFGCTNISSSGVILYRIKSNGIADTTFGVNGLRGVNFGTGTNTLSGLLIQPDGRIICVGTVNNNFTLLRVNQAGNIDNTFNGTGKNVTSFGNEFSSTADRAMVMPDGKIVLMGSSHGNTPLNDTVFNIAMARYTSGIHVGMMELEQLAEVLVYPNPVQEALTIQYSLPSSAPVSMAMYDLQGRLVQQIVTGQLQNAGEHYEKIMLGTNMNNGFYILEITTGAVKKSIKIMKM